MKFPWLKKAWEKSPAARQAAKQARLAMGSKPYAYWACSITGLDSAQKMRVQEVADCLSRLLKVRDGLQIFQPFETTQIEAWQKDPQGLFCFDLEMVHGASAVIVHLDQKHPSYGVGGETMAAFLWNKPVVPWCTESIERISPFIRGQLLCAGTPMPKPSNSVLEATEWITTQLDRRGLLHLHL